MKNQPATPDWIHQLQSVNTLAARNLGHTWSATIIAETEEATIFIAEAIAPSEAGAEATAEVMARAIMSYAGVRS